MQRRVPQQSIVQLIEGEDVGVRDASGDGMLAVLGESKHDHDGDFLLFDMKEGVSSNRLTTGAFPRAQVRCDVRTVRDEAAEG